jgi:steroid delta-isomerase-like uncharacterized protein
MASDTDIVRRLTDEVFIGGSFDSWDDLVADDFVDHDPMAGLPPTKEGQRQIAEMVVATFADRKIEAEYLETTDGNIVENWVFTGRHTGEAMGIPPSGNEVQIRGIEIWRCADGRIAERSGVIDMSDVFEQAGLSGG